MASASGKDPPNRSKSRIRGPGGKGAMRRRVFEISMSDNYSSNDKDRQPPFPVLRSFLGDAPAAPVSPAPSALPNRVDAEAARACPNHGRTTPSACD
jgi:hypothetical protein